LDTTLDDVSAVELISKYVTLEPGDVILTGTCAGAMDSIVTPGDEVTMSIEGIGVLVTNFV
jgi:2-keto-4-pentenoate hydratase/2-oxohepta-3-ene-1,7-dioic acid hydratase in catechol pathway